MFLIPKNLAMLLVGYPFVDQKYDVYENNKIGLARRQVVCLPHSQPTDAALLSVQPIQPLDCDPEGMSGGPAFVIQLDGDGPRAYFAGIIVRGGRTSFRILKAGLIIAFLDYAFNTA